MASGIGRSISVGDTLDGRPVHGWRTVKAADSGSTSEAIAMITRKLGSLLRGKATPFQLIAACIMGALLGFAPGLTQAPALYALLVAALLVVNANLGLALVTAGLARLLSFVAVPVSFEIGRFLLDGPTSGLAQALVNAPVLAWCGFEYYAVAGGQVVGLVVGLLTGLFVTRSVGAFRRRMAAAQGNPSRLRELSARPWARFLIWLFFGGTGKQTWGEKLSKRVGNPVRVWGAALMVLLLVGAFLAQRALAGPFARRSLEHGLERVNGATVDVGGVELDLGAGKLTVSALALADPNALERDLFRAAHLEADVDQADFLRKRVHVARLVVSEARGGSPRETAGVRIAPPAKEVYARTEAPATPGDYSLEDVLAEYEVWKERLAQARRWIDRLAGESSGKGGESLAARLAREVKERGWLGVEAGHLVDEAPIFRLSELRVEGFDTSYLPGHLLDLRGSELSTHPGLVDAPPRVELNSRDGALGFVVDLAPVSRGGGDGALRFHWKGLAVDEALAQLRLPGGAPFQGGTLDVELDGAWDQGRIGWIDLPLRVTLRDTTFRMEGVQPTKLERLELPIGLAGPIDSPRIRFDASDLTDALVAAGKKELAGKVQGLLKGEVGAKLDELDLEGKLPDAKGALEGLLGGKKKKDER